MLLYVIKACVDKHKSGKQSFSRQRSTLTRSPIHSLTHSLTHSVTSWTIMQHYLTHPPFAKRLAGLRMTCMTWVFAVCDTLHYSLPKSHHTPLRTPNFNGCQPHMWAQLWIWSFSGEHGVMLCWPPCHLSTLTSLFSSGVPTPGPHPTEPPGLIWLCYITFGHN